jgi:hypothetical protein
LNAKLKSHLLYFGILSPETRYFQHGFQWTMTCTTPPPARCIRGSAPRRKVIENQHLKRDRRMSSFRVNPHTDARTRLNDSTSIECLFSISPLPQCRAPRRRSNPMRQGRADVAMPLLATSHDAIQRNEPGLEGVSMTWRAKGQWAWQMLLATSQDAMQLKTINEG